MKEDKKKREGFPYSVQSVVHKYLVGVLTSQTLLRAQRPSSGPIESKLCQFPLQLGVRSRFVPSLLD